MRRMGDFPGACLLAAVTALSLTAAGSAWAQLDGHSNAPVDTTANQMEVVQSKCLAILTGQAEVLQGTTRLRADKITIYSHPKAPGASGEAASSQAVSGQTAGNSSACGATDRVEADGQVYYVTPDFHVRGDHAVYTPAADQVVVTGDVIVVRGDDVGRGTRLTVNTVTKETTLEAEAASPGQPGRVRGVFYPSKDNQTGGAAKPSSGQP